MHSIRLFSSLVIANIVMGVATTLTGAIIGSILLETGYNMSTFVPSSIISVNNKIHDKIYNNYQNNYHNNANQ